MSPHFSCNHAQLFLTTRSCNPETSTFTQQAEVFFRSTNGSPHAFLSALLQPMPYALPAAMMPLRRALFSATRPIAPQYHSFRVNRAQSSLETQVSRRKQPRPSGRRKEPADRQQDGRRATNVGATTSLPIKLPFLTSPRSYTSFASP